MKHSTLILIVVSNLLGCATTLDPEDTLSYPKLADARRIYLAGIGSGEGAELVQEKIRLRLLSSDRFSVVETRESADAVLTGVGGIHRQIRNLNTHYEGFGVFRLVNAKTSETIWTFEYEKPSREDSASTDVANQAVDRLLHDTKRADIRSRVRN